MALKAENVSKTYGSGLLGSRKCIFREVSFELEPGKTFGLMGPSGEGKSTLGRIVAGLESPTSGTILLNGNPLLGMKKAEYTAFRRRVQMMFQDPTDSFNPRKRIEQSISEVLKLLNSPESKRLQSTKEMLKTIGLPKEVLARYPSQLSGGQLQRLALGRILLLEPEYIVLDEPTSALDVSVQAQILHLLKKVQAEEGIGYLLISHDEAVIRFMSERIGMLKKGKLDMIRT
ncbi:MAG: ABC transporter ATP-binding protein [Euryarchaeota archaeon]|nr:ABC transporter ATP-binding protein [Euryarchaeota archaeon]